MIRKDCATEGVGDRCSESNVQSSLGEGDGEIRRTRKNVVVTVQV